jgi:hypothetical protein
MFATSTSDTFYLDLIAIGAIRLCGRAADRGNVIGTLSSPHNLVS